MEIEQAFTTYLLNYSGLKSLISDKFYAEEIPQNTVLPAVSYIKISDVKEHLITAQSDLERPIFQFTAFANTKSSARAVINQIKAALCDFSGILSGITIQHIKLENEMSNLETSPDGAIKIYTEYLEFQINYIKE